MTIRNLNKLGCDLKLRMFGNKPYITDNGNYIIDCDFKMIELPAELYNEINMIPGVVDNGLFINIANNVIVGYMDF